MSFIFLKRSRLAYIRWLVLLSKMTRMRTILKLLDMMSFWSFINLFNIGVSAMFDIDLFFDEFRNWMFKKRMISYSKTSVDYYIKYLKSLYRMNMFFMYSEDLRGELWLMSRQMRSAYMRSRHRVRDFVLDMFDYLVEKGFDKDKLMILGDIYDNSG